MKRSYLKHLVCPDTLAPLVLETDASAGEDVEEGELLAGNTRYVIRSRIPSFVSSDVAEDQTVRSFAQKWQKHRYYREHTASFYTDWYLERYGFGDLSAFAAFLRDKKFVLDAGTGTGRDASNLAEHSGAAVYAADTAWDALATYKPEADRAGVALVHSDVNRLPFPNEFFDFINCDQVIHHTPDPPATFRNLRRKLKPGGEICCYVYRKKAVIREFTDDYVRDRIKDLSFEEALEICDGITSLGKALAELRATIDVVEDIPILGIKKGKLDVQRFIHWNVMKCFWRDDFDFFTNSVINADWYHPVYCFRYEPEEFRTWFATGWKILAWDVQEAGISCRARKI